MQRAGSSVFAAPARRARRAGPADRSRSTIASSFALSASISRLANRLEVLLAIPELALYSSSEWASPVVPNVIEENLFQQGAGTASPMPTGHHRSVLHPVVNAIHAGDLLVNRDGIGVAGKAVHDLLEEANLIGLVDADGGALPGPRCGVRSQAACRRVVRRVRRRELASERTRLRGRVRGWRSSRSRWRR
jgi:hypothetical protein